MLKDILGNSDLALNQAKSEERNKVKLYLERQFPDCTKVVFEVAPPVFEDLLKNFDTTVDDGIETAASEKGDGMQRALMLAILQAYADFRKSREDIGKSFLFFIAHCTARFSKSQKSAWRIRHPPRHRSQFTSPA